MGLTRRHKRNFKLNLLGSARLLISDRFSFGMIVGLAGVLAFSSCMTLNVNVNFPESAVQQATDDYVRELYRAKEKGKAATPGSDPSVRPQEGNKASAIGFPIGLWSVAWAEGVFRVNSDKALQIREKLSRNLGEVLAQKRSGVLGESSDGMLVVHAPGQLKPLLLKKVQKLVNEENSAREALYEEVVRSNGLDPARLKNVKQSFSRSFQAESPSGTWVQNSDGQWSQKP